MKLRYKIVPATASDWPDIARLLTQHALPTAGLESHLKHALIARIDGVVVGCVALEIYRHAALLRSLAVSATVQRQGLGHRLTLAAMDLARSQDVSDVYLLTTTAAGFFTGFGFREIERAHAPESVRKSPEFNGLCPDSAVAMRVGLNPANP